MSVAEVDAGFFSNYALPELPESEAAELFERVQGYERLLVAPSLSENDYLQGTAKVNDDDAFYLGAAPGLLVTEHATVHKRMDKQTARLREKAAETGLAGLGGVLHEDLRVHFLTSTGRQSGDANYDPDHLFKTLIGGIFDHVVKPQLFTTMHGMINGLVADPQDKRGFDVMVGVGNHPSEETLQAARLIEAAGEELDLRVGVNQPFIRVKDGSFMMDDEDGGFRRGHFSATGKNRTRVFAEELADRQGMPLAALQVELSSDLRLSPREIKRDKKAHSLGVYMGYLLMRNSTKAFLAAQEASA